MKSRQLIRQRNGERSMSERTTGTREGSGQPGPANSGSAPGHQTLPTPQDHSTERPHLHAGLAASH